MKTTSTSRRAGFTLVELLAVVTIIIILAGLVIGGMSFVKDRQNRETARIQISLLTNALEEYKLDNGSYPAEGTGASGESNILYNALYWGENSGEDEPAGDRKVYLADLDPDNNKQGWIEGSGADARIVDPWGNEYRYRPGVLPDGSANPDAWNIDFDLWSAGKDGKTSTTDQNHEDNKDDVRSSS